MLIAHLFLKRKVEVINFNPVFLKIFKTSTSAADRLDGVEYTWDFALTGVAI